MFDRRDRASGMLARHGDLLGRVARQYSLCADDAEDAVQRGIEIYLRRVESLDPATELAWLKVVVKHEALAVRRARSGVAGEQVDLDAVPAVAQRSVEERLESAERVARSAEVMRRLKRDEARALMLKAEGLSYVEIGERLGWTYTKVNRCITEGRRRFMRLYEELETGAECERLAPTLVALAAGDASSDALLELRPHLRNCPACRATVRELHASRLRRLTAFLPLGAVVEPARAFLERFRGRGGGAEGEAEQAVQLRPLEEAEKLDEAFRRLNGGEAALQPVAPSVAEHVSRMTTVRVNLRGWLETALQRLQSSDVALGIHTAASGGGGRVASVAALIGICVSGVGAGTYCVATALLPDPKPAVRSEAKPPAQRTGAARDAKLVRLPNPAARAATPTATPAPARRTRSAARDAKPKSQPHEQAPISPAAASTQDFSFEQAADPEPVTPAAAPSTGGGEFEP
jgi:RNA polymerase sigma factor (sigma-70 family)